MELLATSPPKKFRARGRLTPAIDRCFNVLAKLIRLIGVEPF